MKNARLLGLILPVVAILLVILQTFWLLSRDPYAMYPAPSSGDSDCDCGAIPGVAIAQRRPKAPTMPFFQSTTTGTHKPADQRVVLSFTVVPTEIKALATLVARLLDRAEYDIFDAIHLCVPWMPMRQKENSAHDPTQALLETFPSSPRIILHRLPDFGPMTRYIGPVQYELHPQTRIVVFDIDADSMDFSASASDVEKGIIFGSNSNQDRVEIANIPRLVNASLTVDPDAVWCNIGQDFAYHQNAVKTIWHSYKAVRETTFQWNAVHMCRGVKGLLVQPRFFADFWYNQTDYHESCFWDDDRWTSFQFERQHIARKEVHPLLWKDSYEEPQKRHVTVTATIRGRRQLGTLSSVNDKLKPEKTCAPAWLNTHPETFPDARAILF
jgi:hypothetical protein